MMAAQDEQAFCVLSTGFAQPADYIYRLFLPE